MLQPTMMSGGDAAEGEDVIRYGEENAIVLDRWLYDVCGEEDMRFPSHRRAQFAPYMQRVRGIVKQKDFLQGSFAYPSRSGTRETLVLQKTLEALGLRETRLLRERQRVEDNLARVERVLQQSALPRPFLASPPTQETDASQQPKEETEEAHAREEEAIEVKEEEEGHREEEGKEKMNTPIVTSPASEGGDEEEATKDKEEEADLQPETKEVEEGKNKETPQPPDNTTAAVVEEVTEEGTKDVKVEEVQEEEPQLPAVPLTETAEYKEKQRLAANYVDELGDKLRQMKEQHAALLSRHQHLLEQDAAVERELRDLSDTEAQLRSREEELRAQATEREGTLHDLQRQWQELSDKNEGVALIEEEEEENGATAMRARLAELRRHLSEVSAAAQETRNTMLREEQAHLTRFRLSRERLKEWQDIVANLRRTAHQLEGQVRMLTRVVRDGALRMHEKPGEGGFLDRLQHSITTTPSSTPNEFTHSESENVQELSPPGPHTAGASITSAGRATSVTSAEPLHASSNSNNTLTRAAIMSRTGQTNTSGNTAGSMTPTLMPLSSSVASVASAPRHRAASCSAMSLTSTPNSKRPTTRGQESPTGHRSRYDLVSHLQRWATVLEEDRVRLVQAAGLVPSPDGAIGPNVQSPPVGSSVQTRQAQMRHSFALLKSILLARVTDEA